MAISLSPFVVLIGLAVWHGLHHGAALASGGAPLRMDLGGAMLVALWNYMGWDNASTIAQEVDHPQKTYPRAILTSAVVVTCVYTLPLLAVWMVGIPAERFSTGAWVDAAMLLGGPALAVAVVLAGSLDGLGTFNALTLSLTRLPYALAEDGLLPRVFTKRWSNGVPWVSVLACSAGWALALGFTFERLISIDLVLYGGALMLEFIALVVLRVKEPGLKRPFRIPGGTGSVVAMGIGPALLIGFALWAAHGERVAGLPALGFAAIVAAVGPIAYAIARRTKTVAE